MKTRRVIAYLLDNVITWILFQTLLYSIFSKRSANVGVVFLLNIAGIMFYFIYYIVLWGVWQRTIGQFLCGLKIKKAVLVGQCLKRLMMMHVSTIYFCIAVHWMLHRNMSGGVQDYFMDVTLISSIVIQLVYACCIEKVDRATGIEVIKQP